MALTQASLSTRIQTEIQTQFGGAPDNATQLQKFADAIAKAVVDEIKNAAVVTVTGVTTGPGTATGTVG